MWPGSAIRLLAARLEGNVGIPGFFFPSSPSLHEMSSILRQVFPAVKYFCHGSKATGQALWITVCETMSQNTLPPRSWYLRCFVTVTDANNLIPSTSAYFPQACVDVAILDHVLKKGSDL